MDLDSTKKPDERIPYASWNSARLAGYRGRDAGAFAGRVRGDCASEDSPTA